MSRSVLDVANEASARINIDEADHNGITRLIREAFRGQVGMVKELIQHGANVNAQDTRGWTVLMFASIACNIDTMGVLLDCGARVNAMSFEPHAMTALHHAVYARQTVHVPPTQRVDAIRLLLSRGADVNLKGGYGYSALHYPVEQGNSTVVRLLLDYGADINTRDSNGTTVLMHASESGRIHIIQLLVDRGADIDSVDVYGLTASNHADMRTDNLVSEVKAVLNRGRRVSARRAMLDCTLNIPRHGRVGTIS